jgi:ribosomal-protein-serine acetyltransferase
VDPRRARPAACLDSDRLVLRCFEARDAPELFASIERSRAHLERWLAWPSTIRSLDDALAWTERVRPEVFDATLPFSMGMFERTTGGLVGAAGMKHRGEGLDVSYWIDVDALGRGYALEAVRRLAQHGIDDLETPRIDLRIEPDNAPSIAVARRAGFRREGTLRNGLVRDGIWRDLILFSLFDRAELVRAKIGDCVTRRRD